MTHFMEVTDLSLKEKTNKSSEKSVFKYVFKAKFNWNIIVTLSWKSSLNYD